MESATRYTQNTARTTISVPFSATGIAPDGSGASRWGVEEGGRGARRAGRDSIEQTLEQRARRDRSLPSAGGIALASRRIRGSQTFIFRILR
jgi:hypothetical protein